MSHHKKIYQNEFETFFTLKYLQHNQVNDSRILSWDITKDKEYTINPGLNNRLTEKYGELIKIGYQAPMFVKWINAKGGYGAYADTKLKKGDMVIEYTGIVEAETPIIDEDNFYLWTYPTILYQTEPGKTRRKKIEFCINAEKAGNFARFINHSLRKYQNVAIQLVPYNNMWHVVYIAQRDIRKGEQLLTHYGIGYWRDRKIVPLVILP